MWRHLLINWGTLTTFSVLSAPFCSQYMQPFWKDLVSSGFLGNPQSDPWFVSVRRCTSQILLPPLFTPFKLTPFLTYKLSFEGKKEGGFREQGAENPTYLPRHPWHFAWIPPNLLMFTFSHSKRCGPTLLKLVCSQACKDVSLKVIKSTETVWKMFCDVEMVDYL